MACNSKRIQAREPTSATRMEKYLASLCVFVVNRFLYVSLW